MAKDLRGFLEPPRDVAKNKETQSSAPLAHRRGLTSPGEPRVFQVRSGFVCGLCGQVHRNLEKAFDCLGRCTVQLRLRSPAGPSHYGSQAHFACTACGRGFANCDDAEQCFERCIHKLKPTKEFETALRRVQVKYAQRLASHGVRQIERIDPFKEHTKMLETLTKEQAALAHSQQSPTSIEQPVPHGEGKAEEREPHLARAEQMVIHSSGTNEISELLPPQALDELNAAPPSAELEVDENVTLAADGEQSIEENLEPTAEGAAPIDETTQLAVEGELTTEEPVVSAAEGDAPIDETTQLAGEGELTTEEPVLSAAEGDAPIDETTQLAVEGELTTEEPVVSAAEGDAPLELEGTFGPATNEQAVPENQSALMLLDEGAAIIDDSDIGGAQPSAENVTDTGDKSAVVRPLATDSLSSLEMDDFASPQEAQAPNIQQLSSASSDFAPIGNENLTEAGLGEDVFAMLQDTPPTLDDSSQKQNVASPQGNKNRIEADLLDDLSMTDEEQDDFDKVYVRQPDMKPYRREHAKYCCSACSKEFFTKEQVEACFFSHPEEGSEEERLLLEKVAKLKNKSAA